MSTPPANPTVQMRFRRAWRPYQQRVLQSVHDHLSDRRLHIVAAPGAGKTTLGLEIFRVLGKSALVLAPSRTIRDQWIGRLWEFLPEHAAMPPDWTSKDLDSPGFLTAITYQALHARFRPSGEDTDEEPAEDAGGAPSATELSRAVALCKQIGVGTLILDEAHHLRQEWWKALSQFIRELGDVKLVCLTATPPYDVTGLEWRRYEELCGPIDDEISVPELVKSGTLCPHQDYLWAVEPGEQDVATARQHDQAVAALIADLSRDDQFHKAIQNHPWITASNPDPAVILEDPEFAVALLAYLKFKDQWLPDPLVDLLECKATELPAMSVRWWTVLITHYLQGDGWPADSADHRKDLAQRMRSQGLLHRQEPRLDEHRPLASALSLSAGKTQACAAIHQLERTLRGESLRQVVLTDFIRDGQDHLLGAWGVFVKIAQTHPDDTGLLTGRVTMIPRDLLPTALAINGDLDSEESPRIPGFVKLRGERLVQTMTRLLNAGKLRVLIGTRSLLGEGWDSPVVNSLVLASCVGSSMMTNQMRGRAIRTDPGDTNKASSIWHLTAVDPTTPTGMTDLVHLEKRFEVFAGLSADGKSIQSGMSRLLMPEIRKPEDRQAWNDESSRRAARHGELIEAWRAAVDSGQEHRLMAAVDSPDPQAIRRFIFSNTLRRVLQLALIGALIAVSHSRARLEWSPRGAMLFLTALGFCAAIGALPMLLRTAWIALWHVPADGALRQIALTLLDSLCEADHLKTARRRLGLHVRRISPGIHSIALTGGTFYEASLFAGAMEQVMGPIENPRYLVSRHGSGWWWSGRRDYHAVPDLLGSNKELAELFFRRWKRRIGPAELIYTRIEGGRTQLLRARFRALSWAFTERARRRDRWN